MAVTELSAPDFRAFFTALWGQVPFAWQEELARQVVKRTRSPWPDALALPTASGKTVCLDIAVFALAAQASRLTRKQAITAPRRIFFVVDRRVIVDEAYERARRLADRLQSATAGILKSVADNLRHIADDTQGLVIVGTESQCVADNLRHIADDTRPLAAHVLRGGMYRSEAWARNPLQPTVVASTVDQVGSRLLFRAYGRGPGTWPIYAGLIANDSLILLDEAHCAQPFLQTLQAVRRLQTWAQAPLGRCFHPVVMSATPPPGIKDVFTDQSAERLDPGHPLGRRQLVHKPTSLKAVEKAKGKQATRVLAEACAKAGLELVNDQRRAIVVFVNRVATARETYRKLCNQRDIDAVLLTGRMRPVDKDALVQRHLTLLHSNRSKKRILEKPLIVVATQTLEVGADLDFDGLVTECASLDALRQRFGRLNRMGRPIEARAMMLIRGDQTGAAENKPGAKKGKASDDPVYGHALTATWAWLHKHKNKKNEVDFGIAHLDRLLPTGAALATLNAPTLDAAVMLPAHVDCWAQTAPQPRPSPDVAPFLRGPRENVADVQVCWRADVDLTTSATQAAALESLSFCPPSSTETLPVSISLLRRWLAGEDTQDESADVEGSREAADSDGEETPLAHCPVIRWRGAETSHEDITALPARIRPGDIIVIPTNHPRSWSQLGDLPPDAELDIGDRAYRLARGKPILRLHQALVDAWPDSVPAKTTALTLLNGLERKYEDDPDEVTDALHNLLTALASSPTASWLSEIASELREEFSKSKLGRAYHIIGGNSLVLVGRRRIRKLVHEADYFSDEDDAAASGISHKDGQPVRLAEHLPGVKEFARRHAVGCGLPDDLTEAIARAGLLHDLGKADPRFQSMLRGGAGWSGGTLLAKSSQMPRTQAARRRAHAASGYPQGGRHELLSVRLAETGWGLLPENDELRDLVLHLVASHHGHCRPFAPVVVDTQSVDVAYELNGSTMRWAGPTGLERLDSGVADRYWRLTRRYGWWGLAWLEALLRLADWRRSEWEETHNDGE